MRKKLPLISGILNVLEKLKGNTGIIENTSVATHTIAAGKYVIWKNDLYKASSAISIGDTLSLSNLTAVSDGIANELGKIETSNLTNDGKMVIVRCGRIRTIHFDDAMANNVTAVELANGDMPAYGNDMNFLLLLTSSNYTAARFCRGTILQSTNKISLKHYNSYNDAGPDVPTTARLFGTITYMA